MEETKDKTPKKSAAVASAQNGKLGGRPISMSRLRAIAARDYIAKELQKNLVPIVNQAIHDATHSSDSTARKHAREWLADRGWGKAVTAIALTDEEGNTTEVTEAQREQVNSLLHGILEGDLEDSE